MFECVLLIRDVWRNDVFGTGLVTPAVEMSTLRDLFFNPLSGIHLVIVCTIINYVATVLTVEPDEEMDEEGMHYAMINSSYLFRS